METSLRIPYGIRRALQREFLPITVHSDSPGVLFYRDRSHATRQAR